MLLAAILVLAAVAAVLLLKTSRKLLRSSPVVGESLPILGCLPSIVYSHRGLVPFLLHLQRTYNDVATFTLLGFRITMLYSKESVARFYLEDESVFNFAEGQRIFLEPMMGRAIVDEAIPHGALILNAARRALTMQKLKASLPAMQADIESFVLTMASHADVRSHPSCCELEASERRFPMASDMMLTRRSRARQRCRFEGSGKDGRNTATRPRPRSSSEYSLLISEVSIANSSRQVLAVKQSWKLSLTSASACEAMVSTKLSMSACMAGNNAFSFCIVKALLAAFKMRAP
jgi:hypothetical protein